MRLLLRCVGAVVLLGGLLAWVPVSAPDAEAERGRAPSGSGQPYAPNWFPEELLAWSPGSDPDAAFNRSETPLASRVVDEQTAADPEAEPRKVMALSVFANTDGNPSQGSAEFDYYLSHYWQYIDTLVFWGGSAGEGLILAPNPTVTDAAHRNGVPVLGTVFLPPKVYGGKLEWTRQLLTRDEDGHFPAARKLARAAHYYGFDGWFVNAETEGGDEALAADMRDFLAELQSLGVRVLWYDSMIESGEIDWQNQLNELNDAFFDVSDLMFLNYGWDTHLLESSAAQARAAGRKPAELHAGINVAAEQFEAQPAFDTLFPSTGEASGLSAGLYRPDFTLTGTDDKTAYPARESRFWVGADHDPSRSVADAEGWKGISAKVAEHTTITDTPFVTYFNTGRGRSWWFDAERWQTGEWNNLTAQDVLPTWRWIVEGSPLEVEFDYDFAYRGGSSLRFHGPIRGRVDIPLFATRMTVSRDTVVSLTQHGRTAPSLLLRFADAPDREYVVGLGGQTDIWATRSVRLAEFEGRRLISVGLRLRKTRDIDAVDYHLGRMSLTEGATEPPKAPRRVRVERSDEGSGARITWEASPSTVLRYAVEAVDPHGDRTWLGATTSTAYYASEVPADAVRVEVVPLGKAQQRGAPASAPVRG